jgi:hypothetical protein
LNLLASVSQPLSTANRWIAGFGGRPKLPNPSFGNPAIRIC